MPLCIFLTTSTGISARTTTTANLALRSTTATATGTAPSTDTATGTGTTTTGTSTPIWVPALCRDTGHATKEEETIVSDEAARSKERVKMVKNKEVVSPQ
jgi:hypothetical protein